MKKEQPKSADAIQLRRRAEAQLESAKSPAAPARSAAEMKRIVHELQVHQIELELQNEELQQTRAEAEAERDRYADLYDFAPIGYLSLDQEGTVRQANLAGAALLGTERARLVGRRLGLLIAERDRPALDAFLQKAFAGQGKTTCEVALAGDPDSPRQVWLEAALAQDGQECRVAMVDITRQTQTTAVMAARLRLMQFVGAHSLAELLVATLDEAEALTGSQVGFYHLVEPDQVALTLQAWSSNTSLHLCKAEGAGRHYPVDQAGVWVDCIRERKPVIHNDYASLPHRKGLPPGHSPVIRELVVPVFRGDRIVAVLGVGNKLTDYTESDVELVIALADLAWEIAEKKRVEDALRDSQQRMNLALIGGDLGTWDWHVPSGAVIFNQRFAAMLGYTLDEIEPHVRVWESLIHWDDKLSVMKVLNDHMEGRTNEYETEHRLRHKSGQWIWVLDKGRVTERDAQGKTVRVCGTHLDITTRKQVEQVQAFLAATTNGMDSEPFFNALARYLAQSLGMDFVCIDRLEGDGLTARTLAVWCDGHFEDNVSYALKDTPCGDVVGKTVCCFPASVCQFFPRDQVLADLRAESYAGVTLWNHTGEPIGLIAVIGRNPLVNRLLVENTLKLVGVRAAGELERVEVTAALQASEKHYRSLFLSMRNGLAYCRMLFDEQGRPQDFVYLQVNSAFETLTGLKNVVGRRVSEVIPGIMASDEELLAIFGRVALAGVPESFEWHVQALEMWFAISAYSPEKEHFVALFDVITDRKMAEHELRESEVRFRLLADTVPMLIWMSGTDKACNYFNKSWLVFTGRTLEQELGDGWVEGVHPDDLQYCLTVYNSHFDARLEFVMEYRLRHADGEYRWLLDQGVPRFDSTGAFLGYIGNCLDISERKQREKTLRRNEERFRKLFEGHTAIQLVLEPATGRILNANEAAADFYGWSIAELRQKSIRDINILPPEAVNAQLAKVVFSKRVRFEFRHRRADGSIRDVEVFSTLLDVAGEEQIHCIIHDITNRKRAEEKLLESTWRLQLATTAAKLGVWDWEVVTNTLVWDERMYEIYGIPFDPGVANFETWRQCLHPDDVARAIEDSNDSLQGKQEYDSQFRIVRPDGELRTIKGNGIVIRDEAGKPLRQIGLNRDITEQRRAEYALRDSLAEKVALLKEVHHRVKNNLQIISSLINLQARQAQDPSTRDALRDTQGRIRAMALLHETLYRQGNVARVDCAIYLGHLFTHMRQSFGTASNRIHIESRVAPVELDIDQAIPCGLIVNELVANAFKHAFPGERVGKIEIVMHREVNGRVVLKVADDGVGLPAELNPEDTGTLGMQLILGLAKQIGATMETKTAPGTVIQLSFLPEPEKDTSL